MSEDAALSIQQQSAQELAKHYTWKKQLLEVCSVIVFSVLFVLMVARLAKLDVAAHAGLFALAFLTSMSAADLVSGLVHWLADTWGTVEVPILGPTLIKNFREHHSDPMALTRKGLVETNGDNCMVLFPAQLGALFIPLSNEQPGWVFFFTFVLSFTFWIMLTNQIHKWAHLQPAQVSWPVRLLQRLRIILPKSEHDVHHTAPFESHYCITNGWLNPLLRSTGFFRIVERLAWRVTGAIPRENDIGTEAAVALAIRQGVLPATFTASRHIEGTRSTPVTLATIQGLDAARALSAPKPVETLPTT